MLIDSAHHDFYDSITAWGIDKTVVYRRHGKSRVLTRALDNLIPQGRYRGNQDQIGARFRVIGFCGRIYPLVEITKNLEPRILSYDPDATIRIMREIGISVPGYAWGSWRRPGLETEKQIHDVFNPKNYDPFLDFFRSEHTPTFIAGRQLKVPDAKLTRGECARVWANPVLRDWGFASIVPPAQAFQDIYMYLSGVLGTGEKETVVIDDKHKAIAHGHDGRYSFRTAPGTGKGNRPK